MWKFEDKNKIEITKIENREWVVFPNVISTIFSNTGYCSNIYVDSNIIKNIDLELNIYFHNFNLIFEEENLKQLKNYFSKELNIFLENEFNKEILYNDLNFDCTKTYIMKDNNTGFYKIGKSVNPRLRERTLQSEKPSIKMIKVFDKDIEKELHNKYKEFRVRGEWFDLNKIQINYICTKY
jgi:hypothetical protein